LERNPKNKKKTSSNSLPLLPPWGVQVCFVISSFLAKVAKTSKTTTKKENKIANPKGGVLADSVGVQSYFFFVFEVFAMFDVW